MRGERGAPAVIARCGAERRRPSRAGAAHRAAAAVLVLLGGSSGLWPESARAQPVPNKVTGVTVDQIKHHSVRVNWVKPQEVAGATITSFGINTRESDGMGGWLMPAGANVDGWVWKTSPGPNDTSATVTGLTANKLHEVRVFARANEVPGDPDATDYGPSSDFVQFTPVNNVPQFPSTVTRSFPENTAPHTDIGNPVVATDFDGDHLVYGMGGTDGTSFVMNQNSGQISTKSGVTYDFETKSSYSVTVGVSDLMGGNASVPVTISLTDVQETSTLTITGVRDADVNENARFTSSWTPGVNGNIGGETWSLDGTDAADFEINSTTGQVSMVPRNYEMPVDENTDNVYEAEVKVTDDDDNTATAGFTVTVNDVQETATPVISGVAATAEVNENVGFTSGTPSVSGHIGGATWSLEGDDAADFTIDSTTGVVSMVGRDFENPVDEGENNVYEATVKVTDGDNNTATKDFAVTVKNVQETATPMISGVAAATDVNENETFTSGTPSVSNHVGTPTWSLEGTDAGDFTINSTTGVVSMAGQDFENPADADENNVYRATVKVTDGDGNTATADFTVTVLDRGESATPVISGVAATAEVNEHVGFTSGTPSVSDHIGTPVWSLDGTDAGAFTINSTTGVVSMIGRNYEAPADQNGDNVYAAKVRVTDGDNNTETADFAVTVLDVVEERTLTITGVVNADVNENAVFASGIPRVSGNPIGGGDLEPCGHGRGRLHDRRDDRRGEHGGARLREPGRRQ